MSHLTVFKPLSLNDYTYSATFTCFLSESYHSGALVSLYVAPYECTAPSRVTDPTLVFALVKMQSLAVNALSPATQTNMH